jgi:flagellar motor switch protein FliN
MHFLVPPDLGIQLMRTWRKSEEGAEEPAFDFNSLSASGEEGSIMDVPAASASDGFVETTLGGRSVKGGGSRENIDMLLDVELDIYIELGRTNLSIKRILELSPGSIVELDRMAGEPVDLLVNDKVIAKGEVVVLDENFGIRIISLVSAEDRIKSLR